MDGSWTAAVNEQGFPFWGTCPNNRAWNLLLDECGGGRTMKLALLALALAYLIGPLLARVLVR